MAVRIVVNRRLMILSQRKSKIKFLLPLLFCIGLRAFAQFSAATVARVVQDSFGSNLELGVVAD